MPTTSNIAEAIDGGERGSAEGLLEEIEILSGGHHRAKAIGFVGVALSYPNRVSHTDGMVLNPFRLSARCILDSHASSRAVPCCHKVTTLRVGTQQVDHWKVVNSDGGVGVLGTYGDITKAAVEVGKWHRVVMAVKCASGGGNKGELRTWVDTVPAAVVSLSREQRG